MFNFPYLTSLVKKNQHCQSLFTRTAQWENDNKRKSESGTKEDEKTHAARANEKDGNEGKSGAEQEKCALHWKKAVKLKFEEEDREIIEPVENDNEEEEDDQEEWLKNWELESVLRQKSKPASFNSAPEDDEIQCKICDQTFETRRLLSQHKRLEHFPSWEGGNKEFCYVPYFVEPKRFNLLRGTLSSGQLECAVCQKWFKDGVKQKVGPYLEGLRIKIKEKAVEKEKNEQSGNVSVSTSSGRRRGRKCKSMSRRVCELCSKILSNRKGLERHMLIHTGEKPFPCDICGKPFRRKDNCVRHKKTAHLFKKPRKPRRRKVRISNNQANATATSFSS